MLKKFRITVDKIIEVENDEDFDWDGYVYDEAINYIERRDIKFEDVTEKYLNEFLEKHFSEKNFLRLCKNLYEDIEYKDGWCYVDLQELFKDFKKLK